MIASTEEFARIWEKEPNELTQLDHFIFLLINEMSLQLYKEYFSRKSISQNYYLNRQQISELAVQLADGLQFFYEQMCFGSGCSLGCPHKLDTPFSKNEDEARLHIINNEFGGNAEACTSRLDCLKHDLMNYVVNETLTDYYTHYMNIETTEKEPMLIDMGNFIVEIIIRFTIEQGPKLLEEPFKKTNSLSA